MEKQLEELEVKYPDKARGITKFNVPLAHMITAGADFMLVPSRFEPCGLIQLHAMRYGTVMTFSLPYQFARTNSFTLLNLFDFTRFFLWQVPIVSCTGGLVDTVKEGYTGFQIGSLSVEVSISYGILSANLFSIEYRHMLMAMLILFSARLLFQLMLLL